MAQALFKSWFVDFDPVRVKANGRDTSLPGHLADLFTKSFEDSELGEIPVGWELRPLRSLASTLSRGLSPSYIESDGVCVLNQKCIREKRIDFSKARRHDPSRKSVEGRTLRTFDILVNSTGVGTLGRVAQVWNLSEDTIVDSHITIVRAAQVIDPLFLGFALIGLETQIEALGEGSTGQTELSRARLGEIAFPIPSEGLQRAFGYTVAPFLSRVVANEKQSGILSSLRSALLPKLISGEIRIRDAERIIGGAHERA
jgi:type I restriction enzyme S subunit